MALSTRSSIHRYFNSEFTEMRSKEHNEVHVLLADQHTEAHKLTSDIRYFITDKADCKHYNCLPQYTA